MTRYFGDITNAIKTLHYRHGIGDVKAVRLFADGRIELDAQGYGMQARTYKGRAVSNGAKRTIHLHRHQLTVTLV